MITVPRLRMFAGPNGSGKSTLKSVLAPELVGTYINPVELEKEIRQSGVFNFSTYGVKTNRTDVWRFFEDSPLLQRAKLVATIRELDFETNMLSFRAVETNSYWASVLADFVRQQLLAQGTSFTFETVRSSFDKVTLLEKAQAQGYRTYLYFIATADPLINISRVRHRVKMGGHAVPEDKINTRYERSLQYLIEAIRRTNRAYIFDNSQQQRVWLAAITEGKTLELKCDQIPAWFKQAVLDKL